MTNPALNRRTLLHSFLAAPFIPLFFNSGKSEGNYDKITDFTLYFPKVDYIDRNIEGNTLYVIQEILDYGELGHKRYEFGNPCDIVINNEEEESGFVSALMYDEVIEDSSISISFGLGCIKQNAEWCSICRFKSHKTTMEEKLLSRIKGINNNGQ